MASLPSGASVAVFVFTLPECEPMLFLLFRQLTFRTGFRATERTHGKHPRLREGLVENVRRVASTVLRSPVVHIVPIDGRGEFPGRRRESDFNGKESVAQFVEQGPRAVIKRQKGVERLGGEWPVPGRFRTTIRVTEGERGPPFLAFARSKTEINVAPWPSCSLLRRAWWLLVA